MKEFRMRLKEKLKRIGVDIEVEKVSCVIDHILPEEKQHWVSTEFFAKIVKGKPRIIEPEKHSEIRWISFDNPPMDELSIATKLALERLKNG